jgi:hypothetical protein
MTRALVVYWHSPLRHNSSQLGDIPQARYKYQFRKVNQTVTQTITRINGVTE